MSEQGMKTILFAGSGRSGSTLLAEVLGQIPGAFNGGELTRLFMFLNLADMPCECGEEISRCPVWSEVWGRLKFKYGVGLLKEFGPDGAFPVARVRQVPLLMAMPQDVLLRGIRGRYVEVIRELYRAIAEVTGCRILIDSGKWVPRSLLVARAIPNVHVLHLLRDGRAVAFSWLRKGKMAKRADGTETPYGIYSPWKSSLEWLSHNMMAAAFRAYAPLTFVRYEDFVTDPRASLARVAGEAGVDSPWERIGGDDGSIRIERGHSVGGNPAVKGVERLKLKLDDEWRRADWPRARFISTAICLPLLLAAGYPLGNNGHGRVLE